MKAADFGNFLLRVVLGGILIYNAIANMFLNSKLPVDKVFPMPKEVGLYVVGLVELVLGVLILIGLLTRVVSWLVVVVSLVYMGSTIYLTAVGEVKLLGLQIALTKDLLLLGAGIYFGLAGSQALGIDNAIHRTSSGEGGAGESIPEEVQL